MAGTLFGRQATVEEHSIAMTRSLGDFYAHTVGVSCLPDVRVVQLEEVLREHQWDRCSLLLASDGVWDLWKYDEVADLTVPKTSRALLSTAGAFCELTRAKVQAAPWVCCSTSRMRRCGPRAARSRTSASAAPSPWWRGAASSPPRGTAPPGPSAGSPSNW